MSAKGAQLGAVKSYADLLAIMRAQVGLLGLNYEILDVVTGYTSTYSTKLLAEGSKKFFSDQSFNDYLGALGIELVAVQNDAKVAKTKAFVENRLLQRDGPIAVLDGAKHRPITIKLPRKMLRRIGRLGGNARAEKLDPELRTTIARAAAAKRWKNKSPAQRRAIGVFLRLAREKRHKRKTRQALGDALKCTP